MSDRRRGRDTERDGERDRAVYSHIVRSSRFICSGCSRAPCCAKLLRCERKRERERERKRERDRDRERKRERERERERESHRLE